MSESKSSSQIDLFGSLLSSSNSTNAKIKLLKQIKDDCLKSVKIFKRISKKKKRIDKLIDVVNSLLTSSAITLIVIGTSFPPLLMVSAGLSSTSFAITKVQDKLDFKSLIASCQIVIIQYNNLARHISAVLIKNNLSTTEYHTFVQEILERLKLIEESHVF